MRWGWERGRWGAATSGLKGDRLVNGGQGVVKIIKGTAIDLKHPHYITSALEGAEIGQYRIIHEGISHDTACSLLCFSIQRSFPCFSPRF